MKVGELVHWEGHMLKGGYVGLMREASDGKYVVETQVWGHDEDGKAYLRLEPITFSEAQAKQANLKSLDPTGFWENHAKEEV